MKQTTRKAIQRKRVLGTFDRLEERCLLAPVLVAGTHFRLATDAPDTFRDDGFVSLRLISSQTGRIEADPTPDQDFGGDIFVVSRSSSQITGGIVGFDPTPGSSAGAIYRVDPYAVSAFGTSPSGNRDLFGFVPRDNDNRDNVSFGGYVNFYDLAFDTTGSFESANGDPTLFVSSLDSVTTAGQFSPRNAVYAYGPDGGLLLQSPQNPSGVFAFANSDGTANGLIDSQIGPIAVAPGDAFGTGLYVFDVACDNAPGVTCSDGDGNALYGVFPGQGGVNLDAPGTFPNQQNLQDIVQQVGLTANHDIDPRAAVFDPNRGIILQGLFGGPAFQLFGGLFVASSDVEIDEGDTGLSRILHFPSLGSPPIDLFPPVPVQSLLIGDMAFDPTGHFGGGIFFTDYITGSLLQLLVDPETGVAAITPFASNFNVQTPTQFTQADPPGVRPEDAFQDAFSVTFSADGENLYVSDRDGIWGFAASTLAQSATGASIGLTDIRELRTPFDGSGYAAAVIDTGIDGAHLGFKGTVAPGFNPLFPSPGNFDNDPTASHGTAVAGIIHQIVPDAVLVPINTLGFGSNVQDLFESAKWINDNPRIDDPRTPQRDLVPIVATNMSLGLTLEPNLDNQRHALDTDFSTAGPLLSQFNAMLGRGIVPLAAAGNEGQLFNGMSGSNLPAILNPVIEVGATYPYGPTPPLAGPPLTIDTTTAGRLECTLEAGDQLAFPGKVVAFSSRNITTDFMSVGSCVPSYSRSLFLHSLVAGEQAVSMGPLMQAFNGTSAATPIASGAFVFGFDVLNGWGRVFNSRGVINPDSKNEDLREIHEYLVRDLVSDFTDVDDKEILDEVLRLGRVMPNFNRFKNPNGVNSILQWSAIPREDVNIGESFTLPAGTDDDVEQQRLINNHRYATYSHLNLANFLTVVEGSVALSYFKANRAQWNKLAAEDGFRGSVSLFDIELFVDDPSNSTTARAMARLLGGADRAARRNRFTFLDLTADQRFDSAIATGQLNSLLKKLLPSPTEFVITNRHGSKDKGFAIEPNAARNYSDLNHRSKNFMLGEGVPAKFRRLAPEQITLGTRGAAPLTIMPNGVDAVTALLQPIRQPAAVAGHADDSAPDVTIPQFGNNNGKAPKLPNYSLTNENLTALNDNGVEFIYSTSSSGQLIEQRRIGGGAWSETVVSRGTGEKVVSDIVAVDLPGRGNRAVYGLNGRGEVIEFRARNDRWTAESLSDESGQKINSSLTAVSMYRQGKGNVALYGLSKTNRLIEIRQRRGRWVANDITGDTRGGTLREGLAGFGIAKRRGESIYIYGTTGAGDVQEYSWNGRRWQVRDLSRITGVSGIRSGTLEAGRRGGGRYVVGLTSRGQLVSMQKAGSRPWEATNVTGEAKGPRLNSELVIQESKKLGSVSVIGRDQTGRLVEYIWNSNRNWTWRRLEQRASGQKSDIVASQHYKAIYSEVVDGAIAEYLLVGGDWQDNLIQSPDELVSNKRLARLD